MVPMVPEKTVLEGVPKFARFNRLKNSARNCILPPSPRNRNAVSFTSEKSQSPNPGPRNNPRLAVPSVPQVCAGMLGQGTIGCIVNMSGLNHWFGFPVITVCELYGIKFVAAV